MKPYFTGTQWQHNIFVRKVSKSEDMKAVKLGWFSALDIGLTSSVPLYAIVSAISLFIRLQQLTAWDISNTVLKLKSVCVQC